MPARFASAALLLSALLSLPAMAGERQWTVLSSGDGDHTHERWQVSGTRLRTLPAFDPARAEPPLSVHQAAAAALAHARRRYPGDDFVVSEVSLQRFTAGAAPQSADAARGWVYLVSLDYNAKGWTQMVPVLLDGSIVLSDNEQL
ncbi:hypothetical protein RS982_03865 [Stenotrophomonas indicatrix]|uniref:hypothetical protein n=1 Tax=Stenotrophomonas indicatrix TaxID=2045451 RepID=UPI0028E9C875|nr:hypothetical protein [Stenotrophomonas indicatrix]MDT9580440.1 hypothetical protein [Stenotrophomonas indicatrix]